MRLYICGPVTDMDDLNRPAFDEAAERLQAAGYEVVVPHRFVPDNADHLLAMHLCLCRLSEPDIDGLALLPGFSKSCGAQREIEYACDTNRLVMPVGWWLEYAKYDGQRADSETDPMRTSWMSKDLLTYYEAGKSDIAASMNNGYMERGV